MKYLSHFLSALSCITLTTTVRALEAIPSVSLEPVSIDSIQSLSALDSERFVAVCSDGYSEIVTDHHLNSHKVCGMKTIPSSLMRESNGRDLTMYSNDRPVVLAENYWSGLASFTVSTKGNIEGTYTLTLTVSDGDGNQWKRTVKDRLDIVFEDVNLPVTLTYTSTNGSHIYYGPIYISNIKYKTSVNTPPLLRQYKELTSSSKSISILKNIPRTKVSFFVNADIFDNYEATQCKELWMRDSDGKNKLLLKRSSPSAKASNWTAPIYFEVKERCLTSRKIHPENPDLDYTLSIPVVYIGSPN